MAYSHPQCTSIKVQDLHSSSHDHDQRQRCLLRCASTLTDCVLHLSTGSTSTSLWTHYAAGERDYCGVAFPDGMRKNDRLARNVVTPTTKAADHDAPVSPAQIVDRGLMSRADWDTVCCLVGKALTA